MYSVVHSAYDYFIHTGVEEELTCFRSVYLLFIHSCHLDLCDSENWRIENNFTCIWTSNTMKFSSRMAHGLANIRISKPTTQLEMHITKMRWNEYAIKCLQSMNSLCCFLEHFYSSNSAMFELVRISTVMEQWSKNFKHSFIKIFIFLRCIPKIVVLMVEIGIRD